MQVRGQRVVEARFEDEAELVARRDGRAGAHGRREAGQAQRDAVAIEHQLARARARDSPGNGGRDARVRLCEEVDAQVHGGGGRRLGHIGARVG